MARDFTTLVSAAELHAHLDAPAWIVFDCRHDLADTEAGRRAYATAHIPGARFMHLDEDLSGAKTGSNGRHPLPDPTRFAQHLAALGMRNDMQAVAYDAQGGIFAARLWWMLRWTGHTAVAVLDGGLPAWLEAGFAVSPAAPNISRGDFQAAPGISPVDLPAIQSGLGKSTLQLIDARAPDRFRGENETLDPVGGHIPGARNRFFKDNLGADGCFKSRDALRAEFSAVLGAAKATDIVHQCGSGVTACHNLLAMDIAGLPGSQLYPGSWSEWCSDASRPVER